MMVNDLRCRGLQQQQQVQMFLKMGQDVGSNTAATDPYFQCASALFLHAKHEIARKSRLQQQQHRQQQHNGFAADAPHSSHDEYNTLSNARWKGYERRPDVQAVPAGQKG
jgi:hypothetical protein